MPIDLDQQAFDNKYAPPRLSQSEFDSKYAPQASTGSDIELGGTDPMYAIHQDFMKKGPYSGEASDYAFSQTGAGRVMEAFGQHFKAGWDGAGDSSYHAELDREAKEKDVNLLGAIRNAWMKPTAAAIDFVSKGLQAGMAGIGGATSQLGEEFHDSAKILEDRPDQPNLSFDTPWQKVNLDTGHVLGAPLEYASEVLRGVSAGALPDNPVHLGEAAFRAVDVQKQLSEARAKGLIGEGEEGYFGVNKPTPEQVQDRISAAEDAGMDKDFWMVRDDGSVLKIPGVPEGKQVVPTVPELAREIDPDTFKEIERLSDEQENIRNSRDYLNAKIRQPGDIDYVYKDQENIQRQIDELDAPSKLLDIDQKLRDLAPDARDAKERTDALLYSDSPEGAAYRDYVQAKAFERAIEAETTVSKAKEAMRRADELLKSTQPPPNKAKDVNTDSQNKSSGIDSGINQAADKESQARRPEVKIDPEVTETGSRLKGVKGTGKSTPLSLNRRMELDSVIRGWKSEVGDVPESQTVKNIQQFTDALEFADENPALAEKVAMGDAEPPENVYSSAVLRVMKNKAVETSDHELGMRLAETKLGEEARVHGQWLQLLRGGYDIDPVGIIQDINHLLGEQAEKAIEKTVKNIKKSVDKAIDTFQPAVDSFLKSIECDY